MRNYLVTADQCLVYTDSPLLQGWEKCPDLKTLMAFAGTKKHESIVPGLIWKGSKIPADLMQKVLGTIKEYPKMETAFALYYRLSDNSWFIKCPKQYGGGASVRFEDAGEGVPEGYLILGSIHTHPEMGAFWSGTDQNDQRNKYGLHFVFGLRDGLVHQHKVSIFTPAAQYDVTWEQVAEPVDFTKRYEPVEDWKKVIDEQGLKPVWNSGYQWGSRVYDSTTGKWVDRPATVAGTGHVTYYPHTSRFGHSTVYAPRASFQSSLYDSWYDDDDIYPGEYAGTGITGAALSHKTTSKRVQKYVNMLKRAVAFLSDSNNTGIIEEVMEKTGYTISASDNDPDAPVDINKLMNRFSKTLDDIVDYALNVDETVFEDLDMELESYGYYKDPSMDFDDSSANKGCGLETIQVSGERVLVPKSEVSKC